MTAPRFICPSTKKALAERGPSIHDGVEAHGGRPIRISNCRHTSAFSRPVLPELFPISLTLFSRRGRREGRAPAGTRGPCARTCTRVDHRLNRDIPAFPARMVLRLLRDLPGETSSFATVAHGLLRRLIPVGMNHPHGLDASVGRRDHTTSPSAHVFAGHSKAGVCSPSRPT